MLCSICPSPNSFSKDVFKHHDEGQENKWGKQSRARLETQSPGLLHDQGVNFYILVSCILAQDTSVITLLFIRHLVKL